ncbi:RNA 3'-terminal phosphate cyclase [Methanobacterium sp.]|uniref:RNA 3'-terminal phosphate cyclase n=1 Tax=Methanobacterium sp. TaxID=2164 RepID=UPI003C793ADF
MIEIDGSHGEGGGALLRISTALSALTVNPIHITNIRANRPKAGLMPQHLNAVKAVACLSDARVEGLEIESRELFFYPGDVNGGNYNIDVKTAGSITLVLQAFMIPAVFADTPVNITIRGGTDVRWSPPINYLQYVTLPVLKSMGYNAELDIIRRGHYPRGGGMVKVKINPVKKLKPINACNLDVDKIRGISHAVKLPEHVAVRQAESAEKVLKSRGFDAEIEIENSDNALGPGSGIVLWTEGNTRIGGSSVGERGVRAEKVGQKAAEELLYHISQGAAVDKYIGDQIIPYMAIAGKSKVKTAELTLHAATNIFVTEKIMGKRFEVDGEVGEPVTIKIN